MNSDVTAWKNLAPEGWTPTPEILLKLDDGAPEYVAAVRAVARGWSQDDARWDVLMALFAYERHAALEEA